MATKKNAGKEIDFVVTDEATIGRIQIAEKQHIVVSILKHNGKSFLSIRKTYTRKDGERAKSCVWVPFDKTQYLPDIIEAAITEGKKRHFDEVHNTPELIDISDDSPWQVKWFSEQ